MSDNESWIAIKNGDKEAFTEMYKAYYQFLFVTGFRKYANKELVKDCVHEMFLELWNRRKLLPEVQHVGFYLKTYLIRKIIKELARENQCNGATKEEEDTVAIEHSYEDLMIQLQSKEEMKQKVQRAIHQLSKREVEVIRMKFFENRTYEEIATLTSATPRTIYNHVYNALKILRKSLNVFLVTCMACLQ